MPAEGWFLMPMMTETVFDMLRAAGRSCARRAALRWGLGFRRLTEEQRRAEVCRDVCSVLFEGASESRTEALRVQPELRALFEAGLEGPMQQVIYESAVAAREATWGIS